MKTTTTCQLCKREHAPDLAVCPHCGAFQGNEPTVRDLTDQREVLKRLLTRRLRLYDWKDLALHLGGILKTVEPGNQPEWMEYVHEELEEAETKIAKLEEIQEDDP